MPVLISVQLPKGKRKEELYKAFEEINAAACSSLHVPPKDVRITIKEVALDHYSVGGVLMSERDRVYEE